MRDEFTIIVNCSSKRSLRRTIGIVGNEDEHQLAISHPPNAELFICTSVIITFLFLNLDLITERNVAGRIIGGKTAVGDTTTIDLL